MKPAKESAELKNHPASWHGGAILACKRCQKRLRKQHNAPSFAKLKKWVKKRNGKASERPLLRVIDVPCLKICPKSAIVVMSQAQFGSSPAHFSIISNTAQLELWYQAARASVK